MLKPSAELPHCPVQSSKLDAPDRWRDPQLLRLPAEAAGLPSYIRGLLTSWVTIKSVAQKMLSPELAAEVLKVRCISAVYKRLSI